MLVFWIPIFPMKASAQGLLSMMRKQSQLVHTSTIQEWMELFSRHLPWMLSFYHNILATTWLMQWAAVKVLAKWMLAWDTKVRNCVVVHGSVNTQFLGTAQHLNPRRAVLFGLMAFAFNMMLLSYAWVASLQLAWLYIIGRLTVLTLLAVEGLEVPVFQLLYSIFSVLNLSSLSACPASPSLTMVGWSYGFWNQFGLFTWCGECSTACEVLHSLFELLS